MSFDIFVNTIKLGEKLLHLHFSDYQEAFEFSGEHYSEMSQHFVEHFTNHSNLTKGEFEENLFRYLFIKSIENRIASDLYSNTSRGNVCDTFYSPFDIFIQKYPTNLPHFLEGIVNYEQKNGTILAHEIYEQNKNDNLLCVEILNAIHFIGQAIGYRISQENKTFKGYICPDFLTRNEINQIAISNFCSQLTDSGYQIFDTNYTRDSYQSIVAQKDNEKFNILVSAEISPVEPGFIKLDFDNLYSLSKKEGSHPYYASISLGSTNEQHFNDGVIIAGDDIRYKINAFDELVIEE